MPQIAIGQPGDKESRLNAGATADRFSYVSTNDTHIYSKMYHPATQHVTFGKPSLSIDPHFNMSGSSLNEYHKHVIHPSTIKIKKELFRGGA